MRLAIDDIGAGFSSLRPNLLTTPDIIKLDRSIAVGVGGDPVLLRLVRSLVDFGHETGAAIVAEGVKRETTQLRFAEATLTMAKDGASPDPVRRTNSPTISS